MPDVATASTSASSGVPHAAQQRLGASVQSLALPERLLLATGEGREYFAVRTSRQLAALDAGNSCFLSKLAKFFDADGFFTMVRWDNFMCNPPLCITEAELRAAFEIIDRGLDITDEVYEG